MTDYSGRLRLALQALDENEDTWGTVLNSGVFLLLEDSISGIVSLSLAAAHVTLSTNDGSTDQSRYMILNCTGTLTANRNVIVPEGTDGGGSAPTVATSKLYLVANNTSGAFTVTVKTSSGSGVEIPQGEAVWVYCDGTDVLPTHALTATTAETATSASDSDALDGNAASAFALLAGTTDFSKAQNVTPVSLTSGTSVAVDASLSNCFRLTANHNFTLANPTSAADGQVIRITIKQGAAGPYTITFGSQYAFAAGNTPSLTASVGAIDYLCAEFHQAESIWIASLMKGIA